MTPMANPLSPRMSRPRLPTIQEDLPTVHRGERLHRQQPRGSRLEGEIPAGDPGSYAHATRLISQHGRLFKQEGSPRVGGYREYWRDPEGMIWIISNGEEGCSEITWAFEYTRREYI
jgi:hypothetical protein